MTELDRRWITRVEECYWGYKNASKLINIRSADQAIITSKRFSFYLWKRLFKTFFIHSDRILY